MKVRWLKGVGVLLMLAVICNWCIYTPLAYADNEDVNASGQITLTDGYVTDNASDNSYTRYHANVVNSYLVETSDGNLVRVEYTDDEVLVETYSADGTFLSSLSVTCELPIFGGFYAGSDAYYLVFAQENEEGSSEVEVMRVVKYSLDWERVGELSLSNINTTVPFDAGSLRMTETNGKLYIHTSHEMNNGHQANMTFVIDEETMTVSSSFYGVWNMNYGYVSHSFDQYTFRQTERISTVSI